MKKVIPGLILSFVLLLLISACQPKLQIATKPALYYDGQYDTYPVGPVSKDIDAISLSVYKVNGIAFYTTYFFTKDHSFRRSQLADSLVYREAASQTVTHESTLGTGTVIYFDGNLTALVTCAHVTHFQDTIVRYFPNASGKVQSVSVKMKQDIFVSGINGKEAQIVVQDLVRDIALLKMKLDSGLSSEIPVKLSYPAGKASDLRWGTYIYVLGFPMGHKMLTHGLVSMSGKVKKGTFISDAVFNRGISGAPVFAIRDGSPHFEWVGMARSGAMDKLLYLQPDLNKDQTYTQSDNYKGNILVNNIMIINYGLTYSISIEEIIKFVHQHETEISEQGFQMDAFF